MCLLWYGMCVSVRSCAACVDVGKPYIPYGRRCCCHCHCRGRRLLRDQRNEHMLTRPQWRLLWSLQRSLLEPQWRGLWGADIIKLLRLLDCVAAAAAAVDVVFRGLLVLSWFPSTSSSPSDRLSVCLSVCLFVHPLVLSSGSRLVHSLLESCQCRRSVSHGSNSSVCCASAAHQSTRPYGNQDRINIRRVLLKIR